MRALKDTLILTAARLGPAGLSPRAPGTAGSALAALVAPWLFLPLPVPYRLLVLVLLFAFGTWVATRAERLLGHKDPSCVVIDELVGQWIALLPLSCAPATDKPEFWGTVLLGFALFRLFDIWKPGPVRASEKWLPAGGGIMIDDVVAGVFAMTVMFVLLGLWGFV